MTTINEIREYLNITKVEFSKLYHIPIRTVTDWESGKRLPPAYIVELLEYAALTSGLSYTTAPLEYTEKYVKRRMEKRDRSIQAIEKKKKEERKK